MASTDPVAQLCADCCVVINHFDRMLHPANNEACKYEPVTLYFRVTEDVRLSATQGCQICKLVDRKFQQRDPGKPGYSSKLKVRLTLSMRDESHCGKIDVFYHYRRSGATATDMDFYLSLQAQLIVYPQVGTSDFPGY